MEYSSFLKQGEQLEADVMRTAAKVWSKPKKVDGFETLRWSAFTDPEGNKINLLEGG